MPGSNATTLRGDIIDAAGDLIVGTAPDTPTRLPIGTTGQSLLADTTETAGLRWGYPRDGFSQFALTSGEATLSRAQVTSNTITYLSGELTICCFTASKTETITTVVLGTGSVAATGTPSVVRVGVYTIGATTITLVAATTHDGSLLTSANTRYAIPLSAPLAKTKGAKYGVGLIQVNVGQIARLSGRQTAPVMASMGGDPPISGYVSGKTDLPASIAIADFTCDVRMPYFELLPS